MTISFAIKATGLFAIISQLMNNVPSTTIVFLVLIIVGPILIEFRELALCREMLVLSNDIGPEVATTEAGTMLLKLKLADHTEVF